MVQRPRERIPKHSQSEAELSQRSKGGTKINRLVNRGFMMKDGLSLLSGPRLVNRGLRVFLASMGALGIAFWCLVTLCMVSLGFLWVPLGPLRVALGCLGGSLGVPEAPFGLPVGSLWGAWESPWDPLGSPWGPHSPWRPKHALE